MRTRNLLLNCTIAVGLVITLSSCNDAQAETPSPSQSSTDLCPDSNHPHMIDLGIGVKWACCNVGAAKPEEYGGYFSWGETKEKNNYNCEEYMYYTYSNGNYIYKDIGNNISRTIYDTAKANWGSPWRMPTAEEIAKLTDKDKCIIEWTNVNGINGCKIIGPNGNSIFLPAAGNKWRDIGLQDAGNTGDYWVATPSSEYNGGACSFNVSGNGIFSNNHNERCVGFSLRPVSD